MIAQEAGDMTEGQRLRRKLFRLVSGCAVADWRPGDMLFNVAMVVLAGCFVGPEPSALSKASGVSEAVCERIGARCRKNRIWRNGKARGHWDSEHGDFAFMLDVMVAAGIIVRPPDRALAAKRLAARQAAKDIGKCGCGRALDQDGYRTCSRCRQSVSASLSRRKSLSAQPLDFASVNPFYLHPAHARAADLPKVTPEIEAEIEPRAAQEGEA